MKTFKSVVVVNAPVGTMWDTVRDRLPELVSSMDDIEKVVVAERTELTGGEIGLTNEWHARRRVPDMLRGALQSDAIGWTDRNVWNERDRICRWTIEPWVLRGGIGCSGETRYESAIGGRGTRVTFEGNFELKPGALSGLAGALTTPLTPFVESIVTTLIPKNLRKVIEAAARTPQPSSTP
jgi:nitrogen fixation protein